MQNHAAINAGNALLPLGPVAVGDLAFHRLLETLPASAYTCDAEGLITYFNRQAAQLWGRAPTLNDPIDRYCGSFKLFLPDGTPISHEQCWMALALKDRRQYNGHEIVVERPNGERLTVLAHANPIHDESGRLLGALNILVDISEHKQADIVVQRLNDLLAQQVARRTGAVRLLLDVITAANEARTIHEGLAAALQKICDTNGWTLGHVWQRGTRGDELVSSGVWYLRCPPRHATRPIHEFQQSTEQTRVPVTGGFIGRVTVTGEYCAWDDVREYSHWRRESPDQFGLKAAIAFPVKIAGEVTCVLEFFSDRSIDLDERFVEILPAVGVQLGHIIERRRLEKSIAEVTAEQQREIGHELHDSVLQLLTGVGMIGETLRQELSDDCSPHAELASKLVRYLSEAQQKLRQVSRGLTPVEMDASGLMKALEHLAGQCRDLFGVSCRFECPQPVMIEDGTAATQLYYLAREATHNAIKHADASLITIRLTTSAEAIRLEIENDGRGIEKSCESRSGMGLPIMRYRASVIGGKLEVTSGNAPTRVVCTLPADSASSATELEN